jgi:hypothetical protein
MPALFGVKAQTEALGAHPIDIAGGSFLAFQCTVLDINDAIGEFEQPGVVRDD